MFHLFPPPIRRSLVESRLSLCGSAQAGILGSAHSNGCPEAKSSGGRNNGLIRLKSVPA